jgi:hypothetical protein
MVWAVVSIPRLVVETSVMVVLGRRVTGRYEEVTDLDDGFPVWRSRV